MDQARWLWEMLDAGATASLLEMNNRSLRKIFDLRFNHCEESAAVSQQTAEASGFVQIVEKILFNMFILSSSCQKEILQAKKQISVFATRNNRAYGKCVVDL